MKFADIPAHWIPTNCRFRDIEDIAQLKKILECCQIPFDWTLGFWVDKLPECSEKFRAKPSRDYWFDFPTADDPFGFECLHFHWQYHPRNLSTGGGTNNCWNRCTKTWPSYSASLLYWMEITACWNGKRWNYLMGCAWMLAVVLLGAFSCADKLVPSSSIACIFLTAIAYFSYLFLRVCQSTLRTDSKQGEISSSLAT